MITFGGYTWLFYAATSNKRHHLQQLQRQTTKQTTKDSQFDFQIVYGFSFSPCIQFCWALSLSNLRQFNAFYFVTTMTAVLCALYIDLVKNKISKSEWNRRKKKRQTESTMILFLFLFFPSACVCVCVSCLFRRGMRNTRWMCNEIVYAYTYSTLHMCGWQWCQLEGEISTVAIVDSTQLFCCMQINS